MKTIKAKNKNEQLDFSNSLDLTDQGKLYKAEVFPLPLSPAPSSLMNNRQY